MNLIVSLAMGLTTLIGSAFNGAPVYLAMLNQQSTVVAAAETVDLPAAPVAVEAPKTGEEPAGTWSIQGTIEVGEYAMPYRIEGFLKARDAEPVLTKIEVGEDGRGAGFTLPAVVEEALSSSNAYTYLDYVLKAAADFHMEGVGLRFCVDILCITAVVNAEGTAYERHYTSTTDEVPTEPPAQPTTAP